MAAARPVQGHDYAGYLPSRKAKFFGLHLALTTTLDQVVDDWLLAPAGPHDSKRGEVLLQERHTVGVLGDNAFRRPDAAPRLKERHGITVLAPPQRSQARIPWPQPLERLTRRLRRRIESALGVLTIVFPIEAPGSRSLGGVVARVATRMLAYTISFLTAAFLQPEKN